MWCGSPVRVVALVARRARALGVTLGLPLAIMGEVAVVVEDRPGHDHRYAIDFSKIRDELGWRPSLGFEAGIRSTVDWYLANLSWCEAISSGNYQRERLGLS